MKPTAMNPDECQSHDELQMTSWQSCLSQLQLWSNHEAICTDTFKQLQIAHSEPQRHYHTAEHINACLSWVSRIEEKLQQPDWVRLAFYFHDAVYDPTRYDNEEQSARWSARFLNRIAAPAEMVAWVTDAIIATKLHRQNANPDIAFLLDIDISILGQSAVIYEAYANDIRREYNHVSDSEYRKGRKQVLEGFLQVSMLYQTSYFDERLAQQATCNIEQELKLLTKR